MLELQLLLGLYLYVDKARLMGEFTNALDPQIQHDIMLVLCIQRYHLQ